ncbi:MAG: transaldolase, partial [Deltaproteobacteria bacterium]
MKPKGLKTRIFLDSGNPDETREALRLLGFLDGQTTNPTLISKNPDARERLNRGLKFTRKELLHLYRVVVNEISGLIPEGSVSIEVYADLSTPAEQMLEQGREMVTWIPNAHIKFPSAREGLKAAEEAVKERIRVNMTLCFTQKQAAAIYAATRGAARGDVFVSPFIGRL